MKKPNPIFLGVITLVALLPHAPRLLPGSNVDFGSDLKPANVQASPLHIQAEQSQELPTAEAPTISAEGADCAGAGLDENQNPHHDAEAAEKLPDLPATDTGENCDAGRNPSPHHFLSLHLADARL